MSSCLIRGVRSVELVSSNLAEAARFYADVWKLAPAETRNNAQYFRGTGSYHHVLGLNLGNQPAVIRVVFDLADRRAITVLHRAMSGAGLKSTAPAELSTPGRGYGFGCKDPNRTRCRWNIPPRSCRSTTPTGRAMGLTGNTRQAAPTNGGSRSRARRVIIACSACSVSPRTAIGLFKSSLRVQ